MTAIVSPLAPYTVCTVTVLPFGNVNFAGRLLPPPDVGSLGPTDIRIAPPGLVDCAIIEAPAPTCGSVAAVGDDPTSCGRSGMPYSPVGSIESAGLFPT